LLGRGAPLVDFRADRHIAEMKHRFGPARNAIIHKEALLVLDLFMCLGLVGG
jgi:hypothetical protein